MLVATITNRQGSIITNQPLTTASEATYDAIVVGGGAAGLSAALMLARSRRSVAVIDAGEPRNAPAEGVHALLGFDGIAPGDYLARGRDEVTGYGGEILRGEVVEVTRLVGGQPATAAPSAEATGAGDGDPADAAPVTFAVRLGDDSVLQARRLVIATGLVDELPNIPGVRERWGRDVLHCPYCHGWEVRDQSIGVLATGPMLTHQALLFRQLSDRIRLFTLDAEVGDDDRETLDALGIETIAGPIERIEVGDDDRVRAVRLVSGEVFEVDSVVVGTRMVARVPPFDGLGLSVNEHPFGSAIESDGMGRTAVAGVWVAGNATDLSAQVGAAAADGARVAAQVNYELVLDDTQRAIAARREHVAAR